MILSMALYAVWFTITNKKSLAREEERMRTVRAQMGLPVDEKNLKG
jgi:hypothetical protein